MKAPFRYPADPDSAIIIHKIKSVAEIIQGAYDSLTRKYPEPLIMSQKFYNRSGQMSKLDIYLASEKPERTIFYKYSSTGELIEIFDTSYISNYTTRSFISYYGDSLCNLIVKNHKDSSFQNESRTLDTLSRINSYTVFNAENHVEKKYVYEYTENSVIYSVYNKVQTKIISNSIVYDLNHKTEYYRNCYLENSSCTNIYIFYDNSKLKRTQVYYTDQNLVETVLFHYDQNDLLVEEEHFDQNSEPIESIIYQYEFY